MNANENVSPKDQAVEQELHEKLCAYVLGELRGDERAVGQAERVVRDIIAMQDGRAPLSREEIRSALRLAHREPGVDLKAVLGDGITVPSRRRLVSPKTENQKRYLDAIRAHDLVIAIGPAGTGKSYLAVAMAVSALMKREVTRIIPFHEQRIWDHFPTREFDDTLHVAELSLADGEPSRVEGQVAVG